MHPLRLSLFALLLLAVLGLSQEAEAENELVEIRLNETNLLELEEDAKVESQNHIDLFIRIKGDMRSSSDNENLSVYVMTVKFYLLEADPGTYIIGYPSYHDSCSSCEELEYEDFKSRINPNNEYLHGYTGKVEVNVTLENQTSTIWMNSVYIEIVGKPQFVVGDIAFSHSAVLENTEIAITAKVWNEGNLDSNAIVEFYVLDNNSEEVVTPEGNIRLRSIGSKSLHLETKYWIEQYEIYQTWYYATIYWNNVSVPLSDYDSSDNGTLLINYEVKIYAVIIGQNTDSNFQSSDNKTDDNIKSSYLKVVKSENTELGCISGTSQIKFEESSISNNNKDLECINILGEALSLSSHELGSGEWEVEILEINPLYSVNAARWYLLDVQGNTKTDGLVSDVYGYYSGQGKAVVFIDNDFNGKLSPGDKFEVHPGEAGTDLESVNDVSDYSLRLLVYSEMSLSEELGLPSAHAGSSLSIEPGATVQFNGAGTDEDGSITKYEWDFDGDGVFEWSSEENGVTTFIYNTAGTYTATLRVTDNDAKTDTDSLTVTVKSPDEEEEGIPGFGFAAAILSVGLIARARREI